MGMKKQSKLYSKKEKTAAVILSTALLSVPFLLDVSPVTYATNSPKPDPVLIDKLGDTIVPLVGQTDVLDLNSIYGTDPYDYYSQFTIYSDEPEVADTEIGYEYEGLLKIKPIAPGTATFTVHYFSDGVEFEDTFQVTVDSTISSEKKFDIVDAVKKISSFPVEYSSQDDVKALLDKIGKAIPSGTKWGNHAPSLVEEIDDITIGLGHEPYTLGDLNQLFSDIDGDDISTTLVWTSTEQEGPVVSAYNQSEGGSNWKLYPYYSGTSTFRVVARDGLGGVTESEPFTVTVPVNEAPVFNSELKPSRIAEFLSGEGHILNLSSTSELDLNELFYDTTDHDLEYEADVQYYVSGDSTARTTHVSLPDSTLTIGDVKPLLGAGMVMNPVTITNLKAKETEDISAEQAVNIEINLYPLNESIPEEINLFPSNAAGLSSLTINPETQNWIDDSESIIDVSTTVPNPSPTNSSIVYYSEISENITFVAGTQTDESTRVKVYSAYNENSDIVWYQNDLMFNVIDRPAPNGTSQSIDLTKLLGYQGNEEYWANFTTHFNEYVSFPTVADVTYGYVMHTGSYIVTVDNFAPEGAATSLLLTISPPDADSEQSGGSSVFTIPFIKP